MFYENRDFTKMGSAERPLAYRSYGLNNFHKLPQIQSLSAEEQFNIKVVGSVLPFKVNNYVIENLIDWNKIPYDPIYILTFPQRNMLEEEHFNFMADAIKRNASNKEIIGIANKIRMELNPHPAGQMEHNVPLLHNKRLHGVQHKYNETVLFFPSQGQTCHAYCSFCFRWPQFTHLEDMKIASKEIKQVLQYISEHKEVSDLLITGGDPMIMSGKIFAHYINEILLEDIPHLHTIRIGSKSLSYWPYKFVTDKDADLILKSFERVVKSGRQLSFMAHFNHYKELKTEIVKKAISRILSTGAVIRTQSPVIKHINDKSVVWEQMWKEQVKHGMIPYYMFIPRDTGAQEYFKVSLIDAWDIFRNAYKKVSGNARTVRGPVMSCHPGKVQILGISQIGGDDIMVLRFIQGRNPDWIHKPFFAEYDEETYWIDDLKPAFGEEKFFFEDDLDEIKNIREFIPLIVED